MSSIRLLFSHTAAIHHPSKITAPNEMAFSRTLHCDDGRKARVANLVAWQPVGAKSNWTELRHLVSYVVGTENRDAILRYP